ncbi:hypothetical protein K070079E91_60350 [Eisenbergiella porci]
MILTDIRRDLTGINSFFKGKKALHEALVKAVRPDARPVAAQYGGSKWFTLSVPGGHPFCLVIRD